jgi:hypothetical protein
VTPVRVAKERHANASNKSTADQKAVKALPNDKIAAVRIGDKVKNLKTILQQRRQPNKRECERGVDKTHRVTDRVPFKRVKAIHILHIIKELEARPTIVFSLDGINHKIAIQKAEGI